MLSDGISSMNRGCMIKVADLRALLECYDRSAQIYEQVASELDNMHKYDMPELLFKAGIMRLLLRVRTSKLFNQSRIDF